MERDGQRANVPEDLAPDELTPEKAEELFNQPSGETVLGTDPETGRTLIAKGGRFGPYVTEVLEEGAKAKPRTASLLKAMTLETVTLAEVAELAADRRGARWRGRHNAERQVWAVRKKGDGQQIAGV
jgi:DNA topoisomerase-1